MNGKKNGGNSTLLLVKKESNEEAGLLGGATMSYESANENLKELDRLRKEQELIIAKINKIHQRLSQFTPEVPEKLDALLPKLRALYVKAKELAENEENVSNAFMSQLDALLQPGPSLPHRKKLEVSEQKRKRIKADADPARLTSSSVTLRAPPEHLNVLIGDQVAARVTSDNADKDEWIVVKVTRFDREANKYEVIDEEPGDDEENGPRKYKLPLSCVIPFPKRTDSSTATEFPTGSQVLAVYPGTTALYKAAVVGSHRKRKSDDYLLEFDDDEEDGVDGLPKRPVPFFHVVQLPEGHRQ
ncbi:SAGA-associated factor 29 homolog A isoform X1 [Cryptomeria japonica]|uniref:SAGA-associated factor 29 homolog A isoform X1 n=1 Tax=Cryptomeria japonica TaxID=3369 RepID=UPI0025ACDF7D|nr:SAGA-associated factor 29 homolog A isoform X1 [Cryptomeria japonica]